MSQKPQSNQSPSTRLMRLAQDMGWSPDLVEFANLIRARYPVLYVVSSEEARVLSQIEAIGNLAFRPKMNVVAWSITDGLMQVEGGQLVAPKGKGEDDWQPDTALKHVLNTAAGDGTIYVFRDLHRHLEHNPQIGRLVRDCSVRLQGSDSTLVILSPVLDVPQDLKGSVTVFDYPLPSPAELRSMYRREISDLPTGEGGFRVDSSPELEGRIVQSLAGMTEDGASNALAKAVVECDGITDGVLESINQTKREVIRQVGSLEAIEIDAGLSDVGGLDNLKGWVRKRKATFSERADAFGVAKPKGLLALGVPGGGKGLAAKAVAREWQLPLFRLDMGSVFGSLVGDSERNIRESLKVAEATAPCVLWVDEIEKGLSGMSSSGSSDGGTTARVFGTFLTWLQERKAPVVVYFTANDISQLPPELLRKGRVDEIFFIDVPNEQERREILEIHLRKRGRDPGRFDLDLLADRAENFVGAEIEQAIEESLVEAFYDGERQLVDEDIVRAFERTIPLAKSQKGKIDRIRSRLANGEFVSASRSPGVHSRGNGRPQPVLPDEPVF